MRIFFASLFIAFSTMAWAQFPKTYTSSDLYHELEKLSTGKRVLYLAAHPDDENTRLIAYFENGMNVRTGYLALTRGDGGQNLIGTEIGPGIGVLRTQELLAARRIDGGEQFFTRAVDFGYSKSAEESFDKWGKENILADVVWTIRKFRPDVIITRFPPTRAAGHGHHEASAILAEEAFDLAADSTAFPEQLKYVDVWQPTRLYFNASSWWNKDLPQIAAANPDDYVTIDIGTTNELLGESYAQMAAMSRSQHRSQGFGTDFPYGKSIEYLKYVKGKKLNRGTDILSGISTGWERYDAQDIEEMILNILNDFDFKKPEASIPALITVAKEIGKLTPNPFFKHKESEVNNLILNLMHVTTEFVTSEKYTVPGGEISADLMINNPERDLILLRNADYGDQELSKGDSLFNNDVFTKSVVLKIPENAPFSNPYWLNAPFTNIYKTDDYNLLGKPENKPAITADLTLSIEGYTFVKKVQLREKKVDPARGVIYNPVYIVPKVSFNFSEDVVIAAKGSDAKMVRLTVTNHDSDFKGKVSLKLPNGWQVNPESMNVEFSRPDESVVLVYEVKADANAKEGEALVVATPASGTLREPAMSLQRIDYEHIPAQIILKEAETKLVPLDLKKGDVKRIGYIDGPGDDVAKYLEAAGYTIEHIDAVTLRNGDLSRYDAILTGIRAFNTRPELAFDNDNLNAYVKAGGTWIVQYNTSRGLVTDKIGPYPFTISHERVTEEDAPPTFLVPGSPVFNIPNKITQKDFDGWVQERGLYFASDWSKDFTPLIGWHDAGEPSRDGGLLLAKYGNGYFVYTGISFFRELPAGVPGAYRLLANILALKNSPPKN